MKSIIAQPRWKGVIYSKSKINNAGRKIRCNNLTESEYANAVEVIDNWRAAHAYPMHVIYIHLRKMAAGHNYIVAERLKRLDSIIGKLIREPSMALWNMQDLGGCRFIVPTVAEVYANAEKYRNSRARHIYRENLSKDYIEFPKASGYRGIHEVYEFHSDKKEDLNGKFLIEVQIRTYLQHLWATAVETMGLFTKQAIKSGQGSDEVKRFFALVSSLFALEEDKPVVPNTSSDRSELVDEIKELNQKNNYLGMLKMIRVAVNFEDRLQAKQSRKKNNKGYCLLILNYQEKHLQVRFFSPSDIEYANTLYAKIESEKAGSNIDAVLVRVSSFDELKSAYPNYFSDIGQFISKVEKYL